jgi:SAM-dependent methyltransferase
VDSCINYNVDSLKFWQQRWDRHIVPHTSTKYPEGEDNIANLLHAVDDSSVREIGCGYGRLANLFDTQKYIGYDISPGVLEKARRENPTYTFIDWNFTEIPFCETTLLYVVMLHVDDDDLLPYCKLISNTNRIIIGDLMIKGWEHLNAQPLCFAREPIDYINIFRNHGFTKSDIKQAMHPHYCGMFTVLTLEKE